MIEDTLRFIRAVLTEELQRSRMPFPVEGSVCYGWAEGIRRGGETILYTGCAYQLAKIGETYDRLLPMISKIRGIEALSPMARRFMKPDKREIARVYRILRNIAFMLRSSGVDFGYLYEEEPYSGTILLELGMVEDFRRYGEKVFSLFKERGIRRIVTVDPHTHYSMLRLKGMLGYGPEVLNYLELIRGVKGEGTFVLHDSCLYARFLGMRDKLRGVLRDAGVELKEDDMVTGKETSMCCGGPLAPLSGEVSRKISEMRASSLKAVHDKVLVACPFCYVNLSPFVETHDIAEVLSVG